MKHNAQLKMEICRQSGETIVGTVTVNQENFIVNDKIDFT